MMGNPVAREISVALSYLLKRNGINEARLAKETDLPRATINRLVCGRTPDPRISTLQVIANYFDVTVDQIVGKEPIMLANTHTKAKWLPIFSWEQAKNWETHIESEHAEITEWANSDPSTSAAKFALRVEGESMSPQFQDKTILLIDAEKPASNRDFVIVYLADTNETLFRQLFCDGKYQALKPINPIFPVVNIKEKDTIIGVVVGAKNIFT